MCCCRQGLALYAARRNDALQRDGVSRLSAYHHYGMVSPFKLAREAALDKSGAAAMLMGHVQCLSKSCPWLGGLGHEVLAAAVR
jgi:hypothetical protein